MSTEIEIFDATRMQEIEDGTIVSGAVVEDNLILTKHDESTVDAGNVRGPQGIQGEAGPQGLKGDPGDPGAPGADGGGGSILPGSEQTDNYALVLGDEGKVIEGNTAGAAQLWIPPDSDTNFAVGSFFYLYQLGAGQWEIHPFDETVVVHSKSGLLTSGQYGMAILRKRAANEWVAWGDLTT